MMALRTIAIGLTLLLGWMLAAPAGWAASIDWPAQPSHLQLETPYGTLGVRTSEYVYESRLQIDNTDVQPAVRGLLNITYAFNLPTASVALVSISSGDNQCPMSYRWVTLKKDSHTVSPAFGSCSEQIKVSARHGALTLQTPNTEKADKIDVYVYDGKTIKLRSKP